MKGELCTNQKTQTSESWKMMSERMNASSFFTTRPAFSHFCPVVQPGQQPHLRCNPFATRPSQAQVKTGVTVSSTMPMDWEPSPAQASRSILRAKRKNPASNSQPQFGGGVRKVTFSFKNTNTMNAWPSTWSVMVDESEPMDFQPTPAPFAAPMVDKSEPMCVDPLPAAFAGLPSSAPYMALLLEPYSGHAFNGVLRYKLKNRASPYVGAQFK